MPDHLSLQRVPEGRPPVQLARLPDVVQDRPRHQQVPVHLGIERRRRPAHPHQRHHMLQQPADPRMMQHLRRRRRAVRRPNLLVVEEREHQPPQLRILELVDIAAQFSPHLPDVELRRRHKVRRFHLALRRQTHLGQRDLPLPLVLRHLPLHLDVTALRARRNRRSDLVPHPRLDHPRLVAQGQRQILPRAGLLLPHRHRRHRKKRRHRRPIELRRIHHKKFFHAPSIPPPKTSSAPIGPAHR